MALFLQPRTLDEALQALRSGRWTPLAGGTDFFPARAAGPVLDDVLDLSLIGALKGIADEGDGLAIGACTTWTALARAAQPPAFAALQAAAREVGSAQIQNRATLGGNLANASPAADGAPALLVLDAEIELRSAKATRRLPLQNFMLGNRQTARRPDELLTRILVPKSSVAGASAFQKLGSRRYLVISVAMCVARIEAGPDGRVVRAALALGACSPVALRLSALERDLVGVEAAPAPLRAALDPARHLVELSPIDDIRGSARYRREAAAEIVARALADAAARLAPVPARAA